MCTPSLLGKPLGKDGLRWLKIHCVNITGLLKRESVARRLEYAEEHIDDMIDSANNPFEGNSFLASPAIYRSLQAKVGG